MSSSITRLGLDVGGVYVKVVVLDNHARVMHRVARAHQGNPVAVVRKELEHLNLRHPVAVGITGVYAKMVAGGMNLVPVDFVNAEIRSVKQVFPEVRNIINVGGSSVTLIQLDEDGNFLDYSTNSLCAAGTGSFLDKQADRLGIRYEDLDSLEHDDSPPPIATRCSVFAKTDLIHRQQEGYGKASLWSGLCKSMTSTFLNTLLRGRPLRGLTVLTGGVSQNREVLHWLEARYGDQVRTFENATYSGALGAAYMTNGLVDNLTHTVQLLHDTSKGASEAGRGPRLAFHKSHYPSFEVAESYVDDLDNEVRVTDWPEGARVEAYLGIDVGSTSTKVLLMDSEERVIADVYRQTAGDPIQATKHLLTAIINLAKRKGSEVRVLGAGTTGSGRKLVGAVIGADAVINEITAHLAGATHVDPRVDTIFEIGGQDAKYIHARDGRIYDSNMNYVCAAGTGSFVEEQAKKLGLDLTEIGDIVMGIAPPITSDRCTVFMEQDVDRLLRQGYSREECMAAVLCSVVKNYLNKVVGRRHVSRQRVFFQGATARNKGLVAAFENVLDVAMVVSPYCHVMGSYGVALLTKRQMEAQASETTFKGLDLSERKITLHTERCDLCQNHCLITVAEIEGEEEQPSWGYMCGRDPEAKRVRVQREMKPFRKRVSLLFKGRTEPRQTAKGTIGIPRCLITFSQYPLWRTFFTHLGYRVVLSGRTDAETIRRGSELTAAEFCFPIKMAHGHAAHLAEDGAVDYIFLPQLICSEPNPKTSNSYYCPFVQSFPNVMRSALTVHGVDASRLLMPVVDFTVRQKTALDELEQGLAKPLGVSRMRMRRAWREAKRAQEAFEEERREEGLRALLEIEERGEPAIALIGRPYNTLDLGSNLALPQKIADMGLTVMPMDMLPYNIRKLNPAFENMYWAYGQHILSALEYVRNHPQLFAIYFSNFLCGPDSFLLSFAEELMGEKPLLTLELDEHGGDAGYLTRVEAFLDVVRAWPVRQQAPFRIPEPKLNVKKLKKRTLWIPNMHPIGAPLYAAAMRADGFKAESLPLETRDSFDLGRSLTRGSECLPTACTTGSFISVLRDGNLDPKEHALFMPGSDGPCRFGQYGMLQRMVLNRLGMSDVPLLAPSCRNSYQGLSQRLRVRMWRAIVAADMLLKAACKIRPYEIERGAADRVLDEEIQKIAAVMERGADVRGAFREAIHRISEVPAEDVGMRPLVGVVGEIYVRCNVYCNDEVLRAIERYGGEAWLAPISEWVLYTAAFHQWRAKNRPFNFPDILGAYFKNKFLLDVEHSFQELASPFLDDRREPPMDEVLAEGRKFLPMNFTGEAIITLGRAMLFAEQGANLVVNAAPFGCMPGTITAALGREAQTQMNVPMVSLFYDGEPGQNQRLEVFLTALASFRSQRVASQHDRPELVHGG